MIPLEGNAIYQVTAKEFCEWQGVYSEIDVLSELHKLRNWNLANPNKRKQRPHILRHIHTWLTKAQQQKLQLPASRHAFSMTFDHNLQIAKKWLDPSALSDQQAHKNNDLLVVKGKNVYDDS
ncbi:MAG: hypothetical protein E6K54_05580 [Gammaproteobacteria bacterium]|nr:MAG: hypothetical protein E6K54_05580 [Gammaproteobacteria bacterium]